jgi:deoxyribonucleoside regulator
MSTIDENVLIMVAKLYYMEGLSQQQIADRISVSRPTVSNLLKRCKEEGIVEIRIRETTSLLAVLQRELKSMFGLDDVVVVPSEPDVSKTTEATGRAAAGLVASSMRDGLTIGISWGSTTYCVIDAFEEVTTCQGIRVVQLVGAFGAINQSYDGFELARIFAKKLNGSYSTIQAPAIVRSVEARQHFFGEPGIAAAIALARQADLAILSVSPDEPESSSLVRAGFITREESEVIRRNGGVGHSCGGIHFNIDGAAIPTLLDERIVGITVDDLRKIPRVILAACGVIKADAILGALRSGIFHALAIDETAALRVLSQAK